MTIDELKNLIKNQNASYQYARDSQQQDLGMQSLVKEGDKYYLNANGAKLEVPKSIVRSYTSPEYMRQFGEDQGAVEIAPGDYADSKAIGGYLRGTQAQTPEALRQALMNGEDLAGLNIGDTYNAGNDFLRLVGGKFNSKDDSFLPANPVGYNGGFKFDPNFGTAYYRDLANSAGQALGLTPEQILKVGSNYSLENLYDPSGRKGGIGFTDLGKGLVDRLAMASGISAEQLPELQQTSLKPLYDANDEVFQNLNKAARIESNDSGFLKGVGADFAKLGPIGTIALTAALGPAGAGLSTALAAGAAAGLPSLLQGDIKGGIKSGLLAGGLAGLGTGVLKNLGNSVSQAVGGGFGGNLAGRAVSGSISGGLGSALSGGDFKTGLVNGAIGGAANAATGQAVSSLLGKDNPFTPALSAGLGAVTSGLLQNRKNPIAGLLGSAPAALSGLLGSQQNQAPQTNISQPAGVNSLRVQQYDVGPQSYNYQGNFDKYGEGNNGNFQFYKPGLLG